MAILITQTDSRDQYTSATGADTVFTITFVFLEDSDVKVYQTPSGQDPDPASDILPSSAYTLVGSGTGSHTRTMTLATPAPVGDIITIIRDMPLDRTTDFQLSGDFSASNLNNQFDRLVLMVQQVNNLLTGLGLTYVDNQITNQTNPTQNLNTLPKLPDHDGTNIPIWTTNGNGDLIAGTIEEDPGASTLRSELANDESGTDGARLVGYYNPTALSQTTVKATLDSLVSGTSGDFVTGDLKATFALSAPSGWLMLSNGTIGSGSSNATVLQDSSAEKLFELLWGQTDVFYCRIYDSLGVITTKGASAAADWAANKALELPPFPGRAVACAGQGTYSQTFTADAATDQLTLPLSGSTVHYPTGTAVTLSTTGTLPGGLNPATIYYVIDISSLTDIKLAADYMDANQGTEINITSAGTGTHTITLQTVDREIGEWLGEEDHQLLAAELAPHIHHTNAHQASRSAMAGGGDSVNDQSDPQSAWIVSDNGAPTASHPNNPIEAIPHNTMQPTVFCNWMIKL